MTEATKYADVIVIGAGAAGLVCAQKLIAAGKHVLVLEAKPTIGGRVHSVRGPEDGFPLELGAEFIHGAPHLTLDLLQTAHMGFYDVRDSHLLRENAKLQETDFFGKIEQIVARLAKSPRDISVREYAGKIKSQETRDIFLSFVEGFHAADTEVMGTRALVQAMAGEEPELNGVNSFRLNGPYVGILEKLVAIENIVLNTRVTEIHWEKGRVRIECASGDRFSCTQVVVTLPIGVLKAPVSAGGVIWDPPPKPLAKLLAGVDMGHVQKQIFGFRSRFWEDLRTDNAVSFLHASPKHYFPTWWTLAPMRTPYLVAWQGGPKALELAGRTPEERVDVALGTLAFITRKSKAWLRAQLHTVVAHNWSLDTAAFGAYSFVRLGGAAGAKLYNQPIEQTIFFAGEAGALGSGRGTVHGALFSGHATADRILKS